MSDKGRIVHISKESVDVPGWQLFLFFGTIAFGASVGWHLGAVIFNKLGEID